MEPIRFRGRKFRENDDLQVTHKRPMAYVVDLGSLFARSVLLQDSSYLTCTPAESHPAGPAFVYAIHTHLNLGMASRCASVRQLG